MKHLKLFENKNNIDALAALADRIVQLYKSEGISASVKYYDEDYDLFEIIIDNGPKKPVKTLFNIEHFSDEPFFNIQSFNSDSSVEDYIKHIMENYGSIWENLVSWAFNNINLEDISDILQELSLENYIIYKDANNYNL